ncbi:AfsR/SARP family transcriptional regulator [Streptomyces aureoverticillatus]|uniref:AfsR/SARP family transcriptional regulator n=1 Tax=Streptomyces aureoverticillatus TaxID=66871 RepID=UPI0013DA6344|nr:BTAD domain-containing putative transcriptional regulator [Streptomyces aureoverticillatus]QIB47205.1 AfsR/SARP family transcriptional regulator [Streptomyces aureoverticillatus]
MRFGVLGPLAVWKTDGTEAAVPGAKVRALLAHLLVHPGHPVSADRLIDGLWGEELPDHPANALQGKVSQLRRALERTEPGGRALVAAGPAGYTLRVPADAVDAGRFTLLLERARATADGPRAKAQLLREALNLWRGEAFADFTEAPFARGAIGRLEEARLTAWEEQAEARLESGEHGPLAADLADLVVRHPLRERLRAAQLRALYRAGRQTEALAAYETLRSHLANDLGLAPGAELAALHGAILRQDPGLAGPGGAGDGFSAREGGGSAGSGSASPAAGSSAGAGSVAVPSLAAAPLPVPSAAAARSAAASSEAAPSAEPSAAGGTTAGALAVPSTGGAAVARAATSAEEAANATAEHSGAAAVPAVAEEAAGETAARGEVPAGAAAWGGAAAGPAMPQGATARAAVADGTATGSAAAGGSVSGPAMAQGAAVVASVVGSTGVAGDRGARSGVGAHLPAPAPPAPRTNLPAPVAALLGRDDDVPGVRQLLAETRLVTLTGPGGVGKTRLAVAAARGLLDEFGDGVWLVELAGLDRAAGYGADAVAEAVGRVLGLHEEPGAPVAAVERLTWALRGRRLLVVLDNCEHLVDAVAESVDVLLRDVPGLSVLATSQEPLDVSGERVWVVAPLDLVSAVELFRQRAGLGSGSGSGSGGVSGSGSGGVSGAGPGARLGADDSEAVAELCVRLDGLPLALELAAARVRTMGVHGLLSRIDDRFALLARGFRGAPARQRTLRAVIDWSWSLLTPPERTLLRRLAVHDGCTLDAAQAVGADGTVRGQDVLDLLSRLVDRSLVVASDHPDGPRYCVLESVREYGAEQLREAGEFDAVRERHSVHYAELAVRAGRLLHGPEQRRWLDRLDEESANLRRALDTAVRQGAAGRALDMVNALAWYWVLRGRIAEARRYLDAALALMPGAAPDTASARALALAWRTGISLREGTDAGADAYADACAGTDTGPKSKAAATAAYIDPYIDTYAATGPDGHDGTGGDESAGGAETNRLLRATLCAYNELDDPSGRATALWILGSAQMGAGAVRTGERLVNEALDAFTALGDTWGTAATLSVRARHAIAHGDLAAVRRDSERSARLFRELGDEWGQLQTVFPLATLSEIAGDYAEAARLHREGLAIAERLGLRTEASKRLSGLGRIALLTGDFAEARTAHEQALRLAHEHSFRSGELDARIGLGLGARREGDLEGAERHMRELLTWFRGADYGPGVTLALAELGFAAELRGDAAAAQALHAEGFDVALGLGDARAMALALEGLAGAAAAAGEHRAAATLLGAAATARASVGAPLPPGERRDVDRVSAAARGHLGEETYTTAFEEGAGLTPETARDQATSPAARPTAGSRPPGSGPTGTHTPR